MFLNSAEILSLIYAIFIWLAPRLLLLIPTYFVVRLAVRHELRKTEIEKDAACATGPTRTPSRQRKTSR